MNLYGDLATAKSILGVTGTSQDADLLGYLEAASRLIDSLCNRHFYTVHAARDFDSAWWHKGLIDDVLSVTSVTIDTELDSTMDGATLVEGTDFYLWPDNNYPKLQIRTLRDAEFILAHNLRRYIRIAGVWGYGDGQRADPWDLTAVTGTVASTTGTALTISVSAGISAGRTIRLGTEQMYVSSVTTTTATVVRAVNGTTATAHAAAPISTAAYPAMVRQATQWLASLWRNEGKSPNLRMQMIGEYQEQRGSMIEMDRALMRMIGGLIK